MSKPGFREKGLFATDDGERAGKDIDSDIGINERLNSPRMTAQGHNIVTDLVLDRTHSGSPFHLYVYLAGLNVATLGGLQKDEF